MDVPLISAREIGRRIGLSPATAWRWARRGLFGPAVDPRSGWWRWVDGPDLADRLRLLEGVRRPSATCVWRTTQQSEHLERLGEFVEGLRETDPEDKALAGAILAVAARRWQRRASGMKSPCAVSAEVVAQKWLTRSYMDDPQIALRLLSASEALAGRARGVAIAEVR